LKKINDRRFVHVKPNRKLFLKGGELFGQSGCAKKRFTHFKKCANYKDGHFDSAPALEDVGCHNRSVFREGIRHVLGTSVFD